MTGTRHYIGKSTRMPGGGDYMRRLLPMFEKTRSGIKLRNCRFPMWVSDPHNFEPVWDGRVHYTYKRVGPLPVHLRSN